MRIPRIYQPYELTVGEYKLDDHANRHVLNVLRMNIDDKLFLFNGLGGYYLATLTQITKKTGIATLTQFFPEDKESLFKLHLGQAVSRKDTMDFSIQKAVELGISEITPLLTEFSDIKNNADTLKKKEIHWRQVAISACEQCGRNIIPIIHEAIPFSVWLNTLPANNIKIVFEPNGTAKLSKDWKVSDGVTLVIGPEGGFSPKELILLKEAAFEFISLGPRILRFETAAVAGITLLQYFFGDLN